MSAPLRLSTVARTAMAAGALAVGGLLSFVVFQSWQSVTQATSEVLDQRASVSAFSSGTRDMHRLMNSILRSDVVGVTAVETNRDMLLRKLDTIAGTYHEVDAERWGVIDYDVADILAIRTAVDQLDWSGLAAAVAAGDEAGWSWKVSSLDGSLQRLERQLAQISGASEQAFYRSIDETLARKEDSDRLVLTILGGVAVSAAAWVGISRRRSGRRLASANQALVDSDRRFRSLVQNSSEVTLVLDADRRISFATAASTARLGCEPEVLVGSFLDEIVHPDDRAVARDELDRRETLAGIDDVLPIRFVRPGGETVHAEVSFTDLREDEAVAGTVLNVRDVSDRHRLELELRHAQKLESVGQLAAGVAHEINTPIQFVGDNVRFMRAAYEDIAPLFEAYERVIDREPGAAAAVEAREMARTIDLEFLRDELPHAMEQALEGVETVTRIVGAMKAFGHRSNDTMAPADINQAVETTLTVARNEIKYVATTRTDLGALPSVECCIGDINQVLLNLVVNASHAIHDRVGDSGELGEITVTSRHVGDHVIVSVADTGVGIPPEVADHVFEPFFTTKEVGRGTGQGLALCYAVVTERHHGRITFSSTEGVGTTFEVHLPVGQTALQPTRELQEARS